MIPEISVTDEEIAAFQRDGAVVLRSQFAPEWIELLRAGIDSDLASPTGNFARHTKDRDAPAYFEDYWAWNKIPEFEKFVRNSPCAPIAAALLGSPSIKVCVCLHVPPERRVLRLPSPCEQLRCFAGPRSG